jgi:hypothetical protein
MSAGEGNICCVAKTENNGEEEGRSCGKEEEGAVARRRKELWQGGGRSFVVRFVSLLPRRSLSLSLQSSVLCRAMAVPAYATPEALDKLFDSYLSIYNDVDDWELINEKRGVVIHRKVRTADLAPRSHSLTLSLSHEIARFRMAWPHA